MSKPQLRLPPLHALHCFEAVARHLSVKHAAAELHISSAAVSQQIAKLEEVLDIALFGKNGRAMELTAAGEQYFLGISPAFRQIEASTRQLTTEASTQILTLSCTTGFAMQFLLPRLPRFYDAHPDIDIRISSTNRLVDFARDDVDFAVRHGQGNYPGLQTELLIDDGLQPVCSPRLLSRSGRRKQIKSLIEIEPLTLLHDEHRLDWKLWLEASGNQQIEWNQGPLFVDSNGAIEAAIRGHGVALARKIMVQDEIKNGHLVMPLKTAVKTSLAYYLVYPAISLERKAAVIFRKWLCQEIASK